MGRHDVDRLRPLIRHLRRNDLGHLHPETARSDHLRLRLTLVEEDGLVGVWPDLLRPSKAQSSAPGLQDHSEGLKAYFMLDNGCSLDNYVYQTTSGHKSQGLEATTSQFKSCYQSPTRQLKELKTTRLDILRLSFGRPGSSPAFSLFRRSRRAS